jgi:DNA-binding NtrC family response regulator
MPLTSLLVDEIRSLRREASRSSDGDRAIRLADKASKSSACVLIEGEAGTGGDALARAIHECSERRAKPFVRVHAGGRAGEVAVTLFGLDRGAGARLQGKFSEAQGGTLLIQGIEELPLDVQSTLLRTIQDGEIEPVGGRRSVRVDVRVIATAHASLLERVRQGRFREDLYYRLHVLPITLAPLRARRESIAPYAKAFLAGFAAEEGKRIAGLRSDLVTLLESYAWPGNVRQLESAVFRAVALADGDILTPAEFPQIAARVEGYEVEIPPAPTPAAEGPAREVVRVEVRDPHALPLVDDNGEMRRLDDLEADIIRFALAHYRGHMSAVSRRLGIGRSTLYRKLKELGLENFSDDAAA